MQTQPQPRFKPWVGTQYGLFRGDKLRLLILGESHYINEPSEDRADFTQRVIEDWAKSPQGGRFFTILTSLLLRKPCNTWSLEERKEVWEQLAFYNYLQVSTIRDIRQRPTKSMWKESGSDLMFQTVLRDLEPDRILVCGKRLWKNLPQDDGTGSASAIAGINAEVRTYNSAKAMAITHPSGGLSYAAAQPIVDALLERRGD